MRRKPRAIYRKLLAEAWKLTWRHKSLWVFGFFANLVAAGGVFEVAGRGLERVNGTRRFFEYLLNGTLPGYDYFLKYVRMLSIAEPWRQQATLTVLVFVLVVLVVIGVLSQAAIIQGAVEKKPKPFVRRLKDAIRFFWPILGIDVLAKILVFLSLGLATLPLLLAVAQTSAGNVLLYLVLFLIFFPATVVVSAVALIALCAVVRRKLPLDLAVAEALRVFRGHWLVALEIGVILLGVSLAGVLVQWAALILLSVPLTALSMLSMLVSRYALFASSALSVIVFFAVVVTVVGFATAFQYTVWTLFYEKAVGRFGIKSKLERLWHGL